jgi:RNA polymerase sigma-70 factor (ECF subfamily)
MDKNEFAARTEQIKKRLYRIAFLYSGSEDSALDIVGEAIYRGFASLNKLRQPEFLETWITRILINECKKELRRGKRELPLDAVPEGPVVTRQRRALALLKLELTEVE